MTETINGFWTAVATPIAGNGTVDTDALAAHARFLFDHRCNGIVLFGTTGEGPSFAARERLDVVSALLRAGVSPDRMALGAGFPSIADTIALSRDALSLGLRHLLLLPPYYYRDAAPTGVAAAFAAILDGVDDGRARVMLYHIPSVSGIVIHPETVVRLRARYGAVLAGVKDSSADFAQFRAFRQAAPDVAVVVGNETDIARAVAEGGAGTICGMGNVVPSMVRAMFDDPAAEAVMTEAVSLVGKPFLPRLKSAIAAMTGNVAWWRMRPPLEPAHPDAGLAIHEALQRLADGPRTRR